MKVINVHIRNSKRVLSVRVDQVTAILENDEDDLACWLYVVGGEPTGFLVDCSSADLTSIVWGDQHTWTDCLDGVKTTSA